MQLLIYGSWWSATDPASSGTTSTIPISRKMSDFSKFFLIFTQKFAQVMVLLIIDGNWVGIGRYKFEINIFKYLTLRLAGGLCRDNWVMVCVILTFFELFDLEWDWLNLIATYFIEKTHFCPCWESSLKREDKFLFLIKIIIW